MRFQRIRAFAQKTVLHSRFKRASGGVPYNVSAAQRTKELRHLLPFYGSKTPRYLRQNSDLRCTESQAVQGVTDSVASPAKLHSQENVQITEG